MYDDEYGDNLVDKQRWDVFISYSSKDINIVSKIVDDLQRSGFNIWQDQSELLPGMRLRETIYEGIQNSACILILLSNNSLLSKWVINELDAAMIREIREGKSLGIPILLGRVNEAAIPLDLQGKKFIDLRHNFSRSYQQNRNLLLRVVRLASQSDTDEMLEEVCIGDELIAKVLKRDFTNSDVSKLSDEFIDKLVNFAFEELSNWPEELHIAREFLPTYGKVAARRLLMYMLEHDLDLNGFQIEDINGVISDFMTLMWLTMEREKFIYKFGKDIKVGINDEGNIGLRLVKVDSAT
jgi:TIR domain